MFQPLSGDAKRAITESLLAAWLEKNSQYPIGRYFRVGLSESSYALPANYGSIAGGKVWEAAPLVRLRRDHSGRRIFSRRAA
jgi:hypothetical protein